MKKIWIIKKYVCTALIVFLLCSCGGEGGIVPITRQISFTADINSCGESFVCATAIDSEGTMQIEVIEPQSLKGLKFTLNGDKITAEMMGITYTPKTDNMPFGAVSVRLRDILSGCDGKAVFERDGNCEYSGRLPDSEYKIIFSPSGLPLRAELSNGSFSAEFRDMTRQYT